MSDGIGAPARPETAVLIVGEDEARTVRVRHESGYVLVVVAGEVDFASVAQLRERLFPLVAAGRPLVADLDRVTFLDAAGLDALAGAARRAAAAGTSLRVVCARPRIRRLFRVAGLEQAVPSAGTLDEALGMLASAVNAEAV